MSIRINKDKCVGCGRCADVCPGTLISVNQGKANMDYPKDCWGCVSCVKECQLEAIEFYLGADIGGNGSTMRGELDGPVLHWKIQKQDGLVTVIDVDRRNSNQY